MTDGHSASDNFTTIILHDAEGLISGKPGWQQFTDLREMVYAFQPAQLLPALERVEELARRDGLYAAGFVCYEAAPGCDSALQTHPSGPLPLLAFGLFAQVTGCSLLPEVTGDHHISRWQSQTSAQQYVHAFREVKQCIARGESYQVNYTMRLQADFSGDPWSFFRALIAAQEARYGGYLQLGEHYICSASPELFFTRRGKQISCKPMKGTAARGLTLQADKLQARELQASAKNRAENVMIVDMVRNDLGRIADSGSVQVTELFALERYRTLWQLISTVSAASSASIAEIFRALFPSASITGAPKVRTSSIIAQLENSPRGIYTGTIGFITPMGDTQFNVAIRTAHIDHKRCEYGTGGGITWSSNEAKEYQECWTKALVLTTPQRHFELLETILWKPQTGYFLLPAHLQRLADSAEYFGYPFSSEAAAALLDEREITFPQQRQRVRLLLAKDGTLKLENHPIAPSLIRPRRVALARSPIDQQEVMLYHKSTWRLPYQQAKEDFPQFDDVLLWNKNGEITESTIANVVIRLHGHLLTPAIVCGLLPGIYRQHLLNTGRIEEAIITREHLTEANEIYLINSVRGWMKAVIEA